VSDEPNISQPGEPDADAAIDEILSADLTNLKKRVKSGIPLTARQRETLERHHGISPVKSFALNQAELARALGVSRQLVNYWLEQPDAPGRLADGRYDVQAWREWKRNRKDDDGEAVSQKTARARQILLQNERLEMRILAEKKELIPRAVAQQIFAKLVIAAKTRCFSSITQFVTLARIAENSTAASDEIRKEMISIWQEMERGDWIK
jgi:hypothetical protein